MPQPERYVLRRGLRLKCRQSQAPEHYYPVWYLNVMRDRLRDSGGLASRQFIPNRTREVPRRVGTRQAASRFRWRTLHDVPDGPAAENVRRIKLARTVHFRNGRRDFRR